MWRSHQMDTSKCRKIPAETFHPPKNASIPSEEGDTLLPPHIFLSTHSSAVLFVWSLTHLKVINRELCFCFVFLHGVFPSRKEESQLIISPSLEQQKRKSSFAILFLEWLRMIVPFRNWSKFLSSVRLNEIFKAAFTSWKKETPFDTDSADQYPMLIGVYRDIDGSYSFDRLVAGPSKKMPLDEFIGTLLQFKEKFHSCEDKLEKNRVRLAFEYRTADLWWSNLVSRRSGESKKCSRTFIRSVIPLIHRIVSTTVNIYVRRQCFLVSITIWIHHSWLNSLN